MRNWQDPNDPVWKIGTIELGAQTLSTLDTTAAALPLNERIDRGIEFMRSKGYEIDNDHPLAQVNDEAGTVAHVFVRKRSA